MQILYIFLFLKKVVFSYLYHIVKECIYEHLNWNNGSYEGRRVRIAVRRNLIYERAELSIQSWIKEI